MVPDTCLRLRAAIKAIDDIVIPALPPEAGFAHEQLALVRNSLKLAIDHIPHEYAFTVQDARDHLHFAADIAARVGPEGDVAARIARSSEEVRALLPADIPYTPALEERLRTLKQDLEDAVGEMCADGSRSDLHDVETLVLAFSARRIEFERAWNLATGFESDPSVIPDFAQLIYAAQPCAAGSAR